MSTQSQNLLPGLPGVNRQGLNYIFPHPMGDASFFIVCALSFTAQRLAAVNHQVAFGHLLSSVLILALLLGVQNADSSKVKSSIRQAFWRMVQVSGSVSWKHTDIHRPGFKQM